MNNCVSRDTEWGRLKHQQSTTGEIPPNHRFSQISALVALLDAQLNWDRVGLNTRDRTVPQRFIQQRIFKIKATVFFE